MIALRAVLATLALSGAVPLGAQLSVPFPSDTASLTPYTIKGSKKLRPVRIADDGTHTYIQWSADQPIPAVFAVDPRGAEHIVDGYMRGDLFTIDAVYPRLVFRIDKDKTEAHRAVSRARP